MNLLRIRYFIEAAKHESFSLAAQRLYTTQPNISKQIRLLEDEINVKLFVRSDRSVSLTPAGKHVYSELKHIPDVIDRVFFEAGRISINGQKSVMIGSLMIPAVTASLSCAIKKLYDDDPSTTYGIELGSYSQMRDGLCSRTYDMILLYTFDIPGIQHSVSFKVIMKQPAVIIVRADHPLAHRSGLSLIDFKDCDFIATSPDESLMTYNIFLEICARHGFVPKISRTTRNLDSMLICAEMGIGACIVDANVPLAEFNNLVSIPIDDDIYSELAVVWLEENQNPRVLRLVEELAATFNTAQRNR